MEDGGGDDWRGPDEENGAKIRGREAQKQLQQTSPAAAGCLGLPERDKTAADAAEGGAAARGGLHGQDAGNAALLRGARQLQGPATRA